MASQPSRRRRSPPRGQGLVEFALVMPVVLLLVFGVFEFGRYFFTRLTLQHSVAEATRFAVTGSVLADSTGTPLSRVQSIMTVLQNRAQNLDLQLNGIDIDPPDGGGPGDVVTISARFGFQFMVPPYTVIVPNGVLDFEVSSTMKNEPFLSQVGG